MQGLEYPLGVVGQPVDAVFELLLRLAGRYADGWLPSYPINAADYAERLSVVRSAAREAIVRSKLGSVSYGAHDSRSPR